jgi:hypothetical protein
MSITDELREWAHGFNGPWKAHEQAINAIADRIDEAHKWEVVKGLNEHQHGRDEGWDEAVELMEREYVRLPVDADGEPIHIGDVMVGVDKYDSLKKVRGKVIAINFENDGAVDVAVQVWSSDGKCKSWHRAYLDSGASDYHHHHEPTVEDVLREFAFQIGQSATDDGVVAEYAEKLREVVEHERS